MLASLVLPAQILDYFLISGVEQTSQEIHISLDEKMNSKLSNDEHFESKGFMEAVNAPVLSRPQADTAAIEIAHVQEYYDSLKQQAGYGDDAFANTLVVAADQFLARRDSTGLMTILAGLPWFTDWGRDTMIAFSGLTLATRRFSDAREILSTFAQYVHHGMVPNMFPDRKSVV